MMYLSKEATNKDQSLEMQMLLSLHNNQKAPTEKIWAKNGFFWDQRTDLTIFKLNFTENTLFLPVRAEFLLWRLATTPFILTIWSINSCK